MRRPLSHSRALLRRAGVSLCHESLARSPFGRFLPELEPRADITLRRMGFQAGATQLTHTHHGAKPMPDVSACHGNLTAHSSRLRGSR